MKKITLFAFAIAALSLASCKKDRTCTCKNTATTTIAGSSSTSADSDSKVIKNASKGTARANCLSTKYTYTGSFSGTTVSQVSESNCTLN